MNSLEYSNPIFVDPNRNELSEDESTFYDQSEVSEKAALLEDDGWDAKRKNLKISWYCTRFPSF